MRVVHQRIVRQQGIVALDDIPSHVRNAARSDSRSLPRNQFQPVTLPFLTSSEQQLKADADRKTGQPIAEGIANCFAIRCEPRSNRTEAAYTRNDQRLTGARDRCARLDTNVGAE